MREENAIEVKNITKTFKVYLDKGHTMKEKILFRNRRKYEERKVLNGISFEVKKGEAIGLIGHNGCGKSTTLKLLTRIMYPDSGSIEMKGRVSSLIELGAGFHPDMSGRENIYTNASIFGLTKKEIDNRLEKIIEFSELEDFIDNPVRTYSSGMYMRLAFSVAINVDADILLIDEILAVGDANFQVKCFSKLREIKEKGTTIVIVSHSLPQIEQICDKTIWIQSGQIKEAGNPYDVHPVYLKYMEEQRQKMMEKQLNKENTEKKETKDGRKSKENKEEKKIEKEAEVEVKEKADNRWGQGDIRFEDVSFFDQNGKRNNVFATDEIVKLQLHYKNTGSIDKAVFGFSFSRVDGVYCYGTNTELDRFGLIPLEESGTVEVEFPAFSLLANEYYLDLEIKDKNGITMDFIRKAAKIQVYTDKFDVGVNRIQHVWRV